MVRSKFNKMDPGPVTDVPKTIWAYNIVQHQRRLDEASVSCDRSYVGLFHIYDVYWKRHVVIPMTLCSLVASSTDKATVYL